MHLPLNDMTLQEKLEAIEVLWEDVARNPESVESPDWHTDILHERRQKVSEGKGHFTDWDTAKTAIRTKLP
ncbi:MAG: addiction module protein [Terriglobales bacterium]